MTWSSEEEFLEFGQDRMKASDVSRGAAPRIKRCKSLVRVLSGRFKSLGVRDKGC